MKLATPSLPRQIALPAVNQAQRDLRQGGRWTVLQHLKNTLIYQLIRITLQLLDRLPAATLLELGRFVGHTSFVVARRLRQRAIRRARACRAFRDAGAMVRQSFINVGENLALSLLLRRPASAARRFVSISSKAQRTLCAAVAEGRGVVVISAHLGPFELLAARVVELGLRPAVVVRESYDPRLDPLVDAHRVAHGLEVIHRGHPGAAARTLRALRRCRPVGFLIDLESRVPSVSLPFLGAPTRIPLGPQRLCQITGARLLVATLHRRLGPEREPPQFDLRITAVVGNDAMDLTLRASRLLEKAVLARPEDWLWMA